MNQNTLAAFVEDLEELILAWGSQKPAKYSRGEDLEKEEVKADIYQTCAEELQHRLNQWLTKN